MAKKPEVPMEPEENASAESLEKLADPESTSSPADRELPPIDKSELGSLLREGQRYAAHVKAKVALPELHGWTIKVQEFMNKHGL